MGRGLVALALSWVMPATTVCAAAPPVVPVCECVEELGDGRWRANFGYENPLTWTLRGPDGVRRSVTASSGSPRCGHPPPACENPFWGPRRFGPTRDIPSVHTGTITLPPGVSGPFRLTIRNGEAGGRNRVLVGWIAIDGDFVAGPFQINPFVGLVTRAVSLRPTSTLKVVLVGLSGSYLELSLCGQATGDLTPPRLVWTSPDPGGVTDDTTPALALEYEDVAGADEPPPSGVDPATLAVTLDGVDLTALFAATATGATAELPPDLALAEGVYLLQARLSDRAGNEGEATAEFVVDLLPPVVAVSPGVDGSLYTTSPIVITGTVQDADPQVEVQCRRGDDRLPAVVSSGTFSCEVPLFEGPNVVTVVAHDRLGREGRAVPVTVYLDTSSPQIAFTNPRDGQFVSATEIDLEGTIGDLSPIVRFVAGGREGTVSGTTFRVARVPVGDGPEVAIEAEAGDAAGNVGRATLHLRVDRRPPTVTITRPAEGGTVSGPIVEVEGTVNDESDVTVEVNGHPEEAPRSLRPPRGFRARVPAAEGLASLTGLADGPHSFSVVARDRAGNKTRVSRRATLDLSFPVVEIATPQDETLLREAAVAVSGTVRDATMRTVSVNGVAATVTGDPASPAGATFAVAAVPLSEGDNAIEAVAEDGFRRSTAARVRVVRDSLPPSVELQAPERLVRGKAGRAVASVSDGAGSGVARAVFAVDGVGTATLGQRPFEVPLHVPEGVASGETITVSVRAFDLAGNASETVSRAVDVVAEGVVAGHVLADETSLPLPGATVALLGAGQAANRPSSEPGAAVNVSQIPAGGDTAHAQAVATTDRRGRYTLSAHSATAVVVVEARGRTSVERVLPGAVGTGWVPVDARLTSLGPSHVMGPEGGAVHVNVPRPQGAVHVNVPQDSAPAPLELTVTLPPGALAADTGVRLTPLSPQGLPGLLPLGWSPLVAFDLRTDGGAVPAGPLAATVEPRDTGNGHAASFTGWPEGPAHLAEYRPALHAWVMLEAGLDPAAGTFAFTLPGAGAFAVVIPDAGEPVVPVSAPGEAVRALRAAQREK